LYSNGLSFLVFCPTRNHHKQDPLLHKWQLKLFFTILAHTIPLPSLQKTIFYSSILRFLQNCTTKKTFLRALFGVSLKLVQTTDYRNSYERRK